MYESGGRPWRGVIPLSRLAAFFMLAVWGTQCPAAVPPLQVSVVHGSM